MKKWPTILPSRQTNSENWFGVDHTPATHQDVVKVGCSCFHLKSKGFLQANLVILPQKYAEEFEKFCKLNHAPCPVLEKLEPGQVKPQKLVLPENDCDIRTDIPKYRVYQNGQLKEEVTDISPYWRDDLVIFLVGCSFSFERALQQHGIEIRNITEKKNVSMYNTNINCKVDPSFKYLKSIPMVVSMRPVKSDQVGMATEITEQFAETHGGPVHCGDPSVIGIENIHKVDYGDAVTIHEGEIPCFWACKFLTLDLLSDEIGGVTSSIAALSIKDDICITHSPGHMFISDVREPNVSLNKSFQ